MKQQILNPFEHLIWLVLLAGVILTLSSCAPVAVPPDPAGKQFPPTPEVPTLVSSAPASPTAARPTAGLTPTLTPGSNGPLAGWKTFTSAPYQYALSYPSDWSVTTEKAGAMGEAKNVERVTFKQPNYGKPNQFSAITIEAAQGAYTTTGPCQGQTAMISGIKGCRRSLAKGQNPAQEIVLFQTPSSGNSAAYFYVQLVYDDSKYVDAFNQMLATWKFTAAGVNPTAVSASAGAVKTFKSDKYSYTMSYPANWAIKVQTAGPGRDQEYVFLTSPGGGLPQVQLLVLRGAPPITGFENCNKNLQFRGIPACSISVPMGQQPAAQMLLFQKGDAYFHMAFQYEAQSQLAVFDDIVKSFQFTQ